LGCNSYLNKAFVFLLCTPYFVNMASTDTDVSSLVSSVVAAFHGSASNMRTIVAASTRRVETSEELSREKELLDALQAAAQQIARAFAVGKQAMGDSYGDGHGKSFSPTWKFAAARLISKLQKIQNLSWLACLIL
jgi:hypothetical protein